MNEKSTKSVWALSSAFLAFITTVVTCFLAYISYSVTPKVPALATSLANVTPTVAMTFVPFQKTPTPTPTQSSLFLSPNDFDERDERFLFEQSRDVIKLLENVDERLSVVEQAMLDDQDRLIEMRLLRQDIEYIKSVYVANIEVMKIETERIYTFNQWFLGAVITLALGVFGMALSNIKKSEKPDIETKMLIEKISSLEKQVQELQKKRPTSK